MKLFGRSKSKPIIDEVDSGSIFETIKLRSISTPTPKEHNSHDWVLFGNNNSFPLEILEYRETSSIHNSIIESKTSLISGNGFLFDKTRELSDAFLVDNWKLIPFWRKLDKVFWQVTKDQQTFGYSCFEVIYSIDGSRIVDINWMDASRIACGKRDEFGSIESYYYCEDWRNTSKFKPREIKAFDPNKDDNRQLVWIQYDTNNMDYYALPNYYSALKWIKADGLMAEYNVSAINNGFSPSIVFKFYKKPTPEERRMNAESIKHQHGGVTNAGKSLIFYSDGKELSPDVNTLDATNIDQRLLTVSEQIIQNIITAHRAHPQLLGIQTPGKLGYSSELLQSWSIFDSMVIKPERKLIMDAFKHILIFNGVSRVEIEDLVPIKIIEDDGE